MTTEAIAEIREYLAGLPGAGEHQRWQAAQARQAADEEREAELAEGRGAAAILERVASLIATVPRMTSGKTRHDDDCWPRHAGCLADKLDEIMEGSG